MDLPQITPRRTRLAIISTFDELCGIAGYTRALEKQLSPHMDVTVFDLDQFLLRSPHRRVRQQADRHIQEIARALPAFDFVNIQLEYGTLGLTAERILRRLGWLLDAAPAVSITFHTMLEVSTGLRWGEAGAALARLRPHRAVTALVGGVRDDILARRAYALLRRTERRKTLRLIAHNRRDARLLHEVLGFRDVSHHPLSFVSASESEAVRAGARRHDFPQLRHLPADAKLIGTFGFLSTYKGFETAVRALRLLPPDHHLLVFGGVHPQAIKRFATIDPYVDQLLREGRVGRSVLDVLREEGAGGLRLEADAARVMEAHPNDLGPRIHFMGVLDDAGFARAMAICDTVVMPYLEVGQTSSGAIALALNMGCRVVASRTRAFLQLARYFPDEIEFFDIGNYAELAQRVMAEPARDRRGVEMPFNTRTNAEMYVRLHASPATAPAGR